MATRKNRRSKKTLNYPLKRKKKAKPMIYLEKHLQGEPQNKFGGSNSTYLHPGTFWKARGRKHAVTTYTSEQRAEVEERLRISGLLDLNNEATAD
jgi:hypothetical protein